MIVKSVRQLAAHLGKSHTMLNRDLAKGKFREEPGGGFDVEKVRTALARGRDMAQPGRSAIHGGEPSGSGGSMYDMFNKARAAKEVARAQELQLNLRKRQGELLEERDVERTWANSLMRFENRLMLMPDKLAPRVAVLDDVLEIRALIDKEVRAALRALYEREADAG